MRMDTEEQRWRENRREGKEWGSKHENEGSVYMELWVCVWVRELGSILMSAGSLPTPTTITAAHNVAPGLWNQTHYIWYWISLRSEVMQCGLAFSKAGQCRIASLRKELHHKEKEDRGGGGGSGGGGGVRAWDSERETGEEGSLQPEGSFHISIFFLLRWNKSWLFNELQDILDCVHIKGLGICL